MRRSTLGNLRQARRAIQQQPARSVARLEIGLAVAAPAVGPGELVLDGSEYAIEARTLRDGQLYVVVAPGRGAELVLDDGTVEWDGRIPEHVLLLLGVVQEGQPHLARMVQHRAPGDGLAAAPLVRTVAELLAEALGKRV